MDAAVPDPLMAAVLLAAVLLAVWAEVRLRRRLSAAVPPLPRWLPPLVSVPAFCLVLVVVAVGGAELLHRL